MSAIASMTCGKCHQGFDGTTPLVKVKTCGDVFHEPCFFSGTHITQVEQVIKKILCPACNKKIVGETRRAPAADIHTKIEVLQFPKPPAPLRPPQQPTPSPSAKKETRGLKYVTYFAVALLCITIAGVIYPSWIALGVAAAVSLPIGYLIGRKIEQYHAKSV